MSLVETYWNERFSKEGMIWGQTPSKTVYHAIGIFKVHRVKTVFVPGSGYGRNTKTLSSFFQVEGIEFSYEAVCMAKKWDPDSHFIRGSVLEDQSIGVQTYDAIYCFDVLHLFLKQDRDKLIRNCIQQLNRSGIMYFTCFSDQDRNMGIGKELEQGTYEYVHGKFAHFSFIVVPVPLL